MTTQPLPADDERAAFEAWFSQTNPSASLRRDCDHQDDYHMWDTDAAWEAWQAASAIHESENAALRARVAALEEGGPPGSTTPGNERAAAAPMGHLYHETHNGDPVAPPTPYYSAEQMEQQFNAGREFEAARQAVLSATPPAVGTAQPVAATHPHLVSVVQEDANRYCEILTLLGMEEEGDPVAEVQRLQDLAATAQPQAPAQPAVAPMFWVRLRSDGGYEGPIHNDAIERVRKESGGWTPLYAAPQPAVGGVYAALPGNCERCSGSGEDPEGFFDQSRGPDGGTHDGPCRECKGTGAAQMHAHADATAALRAGSDEDAARLNWLEQGSCGSIRLHGAPGRESLFLSWGGNLTIKTLRAAIDAARNKETP